MIDALRDDDAEAWQNFVWLGILSDDAAIAAPMAATLWDVDEAVAADRLKRFRDRSLLLDSSPVRVEEHNWSTYRLSQGLRDVARRLLTTQAGLGVPLAQAHAELLRRYQSSLRSKLWHAIADDGYIHAHLTWHMEQAGWIYEIHQLLHEEVSDEASRRNGWYEACDRLGQAATFAADVSRAWRLAEESFEDSPSRAIALQCRYALMVFTLNDPSDNLAERLPVGSTQELAKRRIEISNQELAYVLRDLDSDVRSNLLIAISDYLPKRLQAVTQNLQTEDKRKLLGTISAIQSESKRFHALVHLSPNLMPHLMPEAFAIASAMRTGIVRVKALNVLAPKLPPDLLLEAIAIAKSFQGEYSGYCRSIGLSGLVNWLPESLRPELLSDALAAARSIQHGNFRDSVYCEEALSAVAEVLPEPLRSEVLRETLATARMVEEHWCRCTCLSKLAPKLPETLQAEAFQEAVDAIVAEKGEWEKGAALTLARSLPSHLLPEVLTVARSIRSESNRTKILVALAPRLPSEQLAAASASARGIRSKSDHTKVLAALAPRLSSEQLAEALAAARNTWSESDHARVLVDLSPHLPSELLPEALTAAKGMYSKSNRARVLAALAPNLPSERLAEVLAAVRNIRSEGDRMRAPVSLTGKLPEVILILLAKVRVVQGDCLRTVYSRASILTALAPNLPAELLFEAFEIAMDFSHKRDRLNTSIALASRMSKLQTSELFSLWKRILHSLSAQSQQTFLDSLLALTEIVCALGDGEAVAEVLVTISEIQRRE